MKNRSNWWHFFGVIDVQQPDLLCKSPGNGSVLGWTRCGLGVRVSGRVVLGETLSECFCLILASGRSSPGLGGPHVEECTRGLGLLRRARWNPATPAVWVAAVLALSRVWVCWRRLLARRGCRRCGVVAATRSSHATRSWRRMFGRSRWRTSWARAPRCVATRSFAMLLASSWFVAGLPCGVLGHPGSGATHGCRRTWRS